jgi:ribose-phosphate pyrophosphokinase
MPYFSVPIVALSTHKLLVHTLCKISRLSLEKTVVVSPDKGGVSRSESFAQEAGFPMVRLSKTRDLTTGDVSVTGISGEVRGKDCIIFDDIINTGATAIKTASFLKQHGAKKIYFLATHGVLAGDASRKLKDSSIDSVILTDTIDVPKEKRFSKMRIISAATLISDAIITQ